jgi:hypothetical protein
MKRVALLALLTLACSGPEVQPPTDTREPIETAYVTAAEMKVYAKADNSAPVITSYQTSEAVSILVRRGDWVEIRTGDGSGWVHATDLAGAAEASQLEDNPTVRFQRSPAPVTNMSAHGEIYIEADVNTDGDVISTRLITNTTGSESLAMQNAASLQQAKFYPIVVRGERKPFKYYHRVTY